MVTPNTSATGGYLKPSASPAPIEDDALQDFLQAMIVGITGMAAESVRPRWQPEPPNLKEYGDNWAGIGVVVRHPESFAAIDHDPDEQGADVLRRSEVLEVLTSFYGPNAERNAGLLKDGLQIEQNRAVLREAGMALVDTGDPVEAPSLVKERWLRRIDLRMSIRRGIVRVYPILNLLSAEGTIDAEKVQVDFEVNP